MARIEKEFYFSKWGYTKKNFQRWGRKGGAVFKYSSNAERQRAYRRRKAQKKLTVGLISGVLNLETGRIKKYRNSANRQKAYRERKKLSETG